MKTATITIEVSGRANNWDPDDNGARRLAYTEAVNGDLDVARTLIRVANLLHPKAVDELRDGESPALRAKET